MIIIISVICVSLLLISLISYRNYQIENEDIRTFLLADSLEEDDYHYNPDLI
jgi:hypothetical protein